MDGTIRVTFDDGAWVEYDVNGIMQYAGVFYQMFGDPTRWSKGEN